VLDGIYCEMKKAPSVNTNGAFLGATTRLFRSVSSVALRQADYYVGIVVQDFANVFDRLFRALRVYDR
jgi:hypothetical protein